MNIEYVRLFSVKINFPKYTRNAFWAMLKKMHNWYRAAPLLENSPASNISGGEEGEREKWENQLAAWKKKNFLHCAAEETKNVLHGHFTLWLWLMMKYKQNSVAWQPGKGRCSSRWFPTVTCKQVFKFSDWSEILNQLPDQVQWEAVKKGNVE